jgi:DNA modification methylase
MSTARARTSPPAGTLALSDLQADPHNRRTHNPRNLGMVREALQKVGAARSIVIDEHNVVLAGNGVHAAAADAGIHTVRVIDAAGDELIAVRRAGLTDEQKRALALYDNRSGELSTWNLEQLAADLQGGLDLKPFFFDKELAAMMRATHKPGLTDPDALPALRATTIKPGDLFALGGHRVLCGDSASAADVDRLTRDAPRADGLFTSPPYNVGVKYDTHDDSPLALAEYFGWLEGLVRAWAAHLARGRAFVWNVGVSPKTAPHRHVLMLEACGLTFLRQFVWHKVGVPVPTFHATRVNPRLRSLTSNYTHEMLFVMGTSDELAVGASQPAHDHALEHDVFSMSQAQATVDLPAGEQRTGVQSNLTRRSMKAHPAAFPVALPLAFFQHYLGAGELVLEPFGGSGSTIIAAEQHGARCFAMEIAPTYCQLAIDRWEAFTGQKATPIATPSTRSKKGARRDVCAVASQNRPTRNGSKGTRANAG